MKLLIDTHVLIWICGAPKLIGTSVEAKIKDAANEVYVSAVSAWEIALKVRIGKMKFDLEFIADFDTSVRKLLFTPLPVVAAHAVAGAQLVGSHKDPFDRLLAGQALVEGATIVTADSAFNQFGVPVVW